MAFLIISYSSSEPIPGSVSSVGVVSADVVVVVVVSVGVVTVVWLGVVTVVWVVELGVVAVGVVWVVELVVVSVGVVSSCTVIVQVAVLPPSFVLTVMTASPAFRAVTLPEADTVATAVLELDQVTAVS